MFIKGDQNYCNLGENYFSHGKDTISSLCAKICLEKCYHLVVSKPFTCSRRDYFNGFYVLSFKCLKLCIEICTVTDWL